MLQTDRIILTIDRTQPFDPAQYLGKQWTLGEQDDRSLALTEIDIANMQFESCVAEGAALIRGDEKLCFLKMRPEIRLDAQIGQTLYAEYGQSKLRWIHETRGVTAIEFAGTVLKRPGKQAFLLLLRVPGGGWSMATHGLAYARCEVDHSPLLPQELLMCA